MRRASEMTIHSGFFVLGRVLDNALSGPVLRAVQYLVGKLARENCARARESSERALRRCEDDR